MTSSASPETMTKGRMASHSFWVIAAPGDRRTQGAQEFVHRLLDEVEDERRVDTDDDRECEQGRQGEYLDPVQVRQVVTEAREELAELAEDDALEHPQEIGTAEDLTNVATRAASGA